MSEKLDAIICMPVDEVRIIIPGSTVIQCDGCHCFCYIAPSGKLVHDAHPEAKILCPNCGVKAITEENTG